MSSTELSPKSTESRSARASKCPGCHIERLRHDFGIPGPNCTGISASPPNVTPESSPKTRDSRQLQRRSAILDERSGLPAAHSQIDMLREELSLLENEEQTLRHDIEEEEKRLAEEIESKRLAILRLRASRQAAPSRVSTAQSSNALPSSSAPPLAPISTARQGIPQTSIGLDQAFLRIPQTTTTSVLPHIVSSAVNPSPLVGTQQNLDLQSTLHPRRPTINQSEILLRPTRTNDPTRGKPLRIVDFVSRLRPSEEEKVFASDNNCVLKLSLQDTKPKLSSVTVEQFNIANLRIFYELLFSSKLPSMQEIREYLAYSVKVLELATKYSWQSVLHYDDEFRVLQHTYGYPWSTDHSHLHEVLLIPRWAAKSTASGAGYNSSYNPGESGNLKSFIVARLPNGEEICRLYNSKKGCQRSPCKYSHVCNRKVGSQACGKNHQGCLHSSLEVGPPGQ